VVTYWISVEGEIRVVVADRVEQGLDVFLGEAGGSVALAEVLHGPLLLLDLLPDLSSGLAVGADLSRGRHDVRVLEQRKRIVFRENCTAHTHDTHTSVLGSHQQTGATAQRYR
jgi:hypothetical protein